MTTTPETPEHKSIAELLRRTEITGNARHNAARRMAAHGWFSQWTLALLTVGQIVISLVAALKLHSKFHAEYVNFASIFFGVLVLTYSLLLGMANYASRAVKMHECGISLGRLSRRLFYLLRNPCSNTNHYKEAVREYYNILEKYENHTRTDYLVAHYEYYDSKLAGHQQFDMKWLYERFRLVCVHAKICFFYVIQFSHYLLSIILVWAWIYVLVRR